MNQFLKWFSLYMALAFVFSSNAVFATNNDSALSLATASGDWIASLVQKQDAGIAWPDDALVPEKISYDLASGVSGKVIFFVALYNATGDKKYLNQAQGGAEYLISLLNKSDTFSENPRKASLYSGISGIGVALINLHRASQKDQYTQALSTILNLLEEWKVDHPAGVAWNERFNDLQFGDTGTVLFLSYLGQMQGFESALPLATSGANYIVSQAKNNKQGSFWLYRRDKEFNLPNFSHGTAGVTYTLATIASLTNNNALRGHAEAGNRYLNNVAVMSSDAIKFPYGWGSDSWEGNYQAGWGHGLVGTAMMYKRLAHLKVGDTSNSDTLERIAQTLVSIDFTRPLSGDFTEPATALDYRFGRAGVLSFLSHYLNGKSDSESARKQQQTLFSILQKAASKEDGKACWKAKAPAFMGGGEVEYTGFFHGAAGIGISLLDMHASLESKPAFYEMPDNPFTVNISR